MKRYEHFGFRGVIAKPYEASELGRKVQAMIGPNRSNGTAVPELQHACENVDVFRFRRGAKTISFKPL